MPGLLRGIARTAAVAGTATAVSNRVSRRQGQRWADKEQQQAPPAYAPPPLAPPVPAPPGPEPEAASVDRIAALKDLADLHAQGVLTDGEFNTEKAKILAS